MINLNLQIDRDSVNSNLGNVKLIFEINGANNLDNVKVYREESTSNVKDDEVKNDNELLQKITTLKKISLEVSEIYKDDAKKRHRISDCRGFVEVKSIDGKSKIVQTYHCHCKTCPNCIKRRSSRMRAKLLKAMPILLKENYRYIFLTLTVKNPDIKDLRTTIKSMQNGFSKLIKLIKYQKGYIRSFEVTKGKDFETSAHPHIHAVIAVTNTYYKDGYISQPKYVKLWKEIMDLDYKPVVDVRNIDEKDIEDSLIEVCKYNVKVNNDILKDTEWLLEYEKQTEKLHFFSSAGCFKNVIKIVKDAYISTEDEASTSEIEERRDKKGRFYKYNKSSGYIKHEQE